MTPKKVIRNEGDPIVAEDCTECVQAVAIDGLKDVIKLQKETVDRMIGDVEESKKDRRELKVSQGEFKVQLVDLKETVSELVVAVKEGRQETKDSIEALDNKTDTQFKAIKDGQIANANRWKWQLIGSLFVMLTGLTVSIILSIMTYLKELAAK